MKSSKDSKKDSKSEIEKRDARILVRPIFFHKLLNLMTKFSKDFYHILTIVHFNTFTHRKNIGIGK